MHIYRVPCIILIYVGYVMLELQVISISITLHMYYFFMLGTLKIFFFHLFWNIQEIVDNVNLSIQWIWRIETLPLHSSHSQVLRKVTKEIICFLSASDLCFALTTLTVAGYPTSHQAPSNYFCGNLQ